MIVLLLLLLLSIGLTQGNKNFGECPPSRTSIENALTDAHINGLVAIVINASHILYEQAFGYDAPLIINDRQPIDSMKSIFVLASISKTFISVAVMKLVELNKLDLDTNINAYLSSDMNIIHPFYQTIPITMRHILTHTSGIGPNFDEEMKHYMPNDDFTKTELSDIILSYINNTLNWLPKPPGTTIHYSNIGASLAALIVEQITHMSFEEYVRENILQPLGIHKNDAGYRLSDFENRKKDLIGHYVFNSSWLELAQNWLPQLNITRVDNRSDWLYVPYFGVSDYPAGLLRMSAHSLAIYLQSFLNNFPSLLLNSSSFNEMIRIDRSDSEEYQFALLWTWFRLDGKRFVGHHGAMPGVRNLMMANEKRTLGVVILSNGDVTKPDDSATMVRETIQNLWLTLSDCFE